MDEPEIEMKLTEREKKLIEMIRSIGYGEILLLIQDHQPVRVEEMRKRIKL